MKFSSTIAVFVFCLMVNSLVAQESADSRWNILQPFTSPPKNLAEEYGSYRNVLQFRDGNRRVKTAADWKERRTEIRADWEQKLGQWPPLITTPKVETLRSEQRDGYIRKTVRFLWTPRQKTTGYLLIPPGAGPFPAIVCVFYEPETGAGLSEKPHRDFARQLVKCGFVALSIGTTEATAARTYALYHPSIENAEVQPLSMLAYAAANAWHVLASQPNVDSNRIGIVGHSFGGKWAMFASCLFDKFACAAWSDPGIVFDTRPSVNYWEPWYLGYHAKPWRRRGVITPDNPARGLYPQLLKEGRDLHELHALMAPRPFLVSGGSEDSVNRWIPLNHSRRVNRILGHNDRVAMTNRSEHSPNEKSNAVIRAFFEHWLKP